MDAAVEPRARSAPGHPPAHSHRRDPVEHGRARKPICRRCWPQHTGSRRAVRQSGCGHEADHRRRTALGIWLSSSRYPIARIGESALSPLLAAAYEPLRPVRRRTAHAAQSAVDALWMGEHDCTLAVCSARSGEALQRAGRESRGRVRPARRAHAADRRQPAQPGSSIICSASANAMASPI